MDIVMGDRLSGYSSLVISQYILFSLGNQGWITVRGIESTVK